ncbi:class A beta-lactamase-related serine hydrolase [Micromonospora sp. KC606]|uniref:serine hydrolase domain-containing protein n=1 Tax=Micromonospora sp. KC606 TaxID=2530379 RepID=UPI0010521B58|nr:serine hydrolase domain-containing protein [Micromonospora sp. KC606]TDC84283.1 class A beta-lactamase-related serine hydrolase [Micromonospora sp. KC606]
MLALPQLLAETGYRPDEPVVVGLDTTSAIVLQASAGEQLGPDTLTYTASLAKQFTGASAALLVQRGLLDIDAPLARWLPELPSWAQHVRLRHLLHHTAALPAESQIRAALATAGQIDWTSQAVLTALATCLTLPGVPGSEHAYSNIGYICLAATLERATQVPLSTFAHQELFAKLNMTKTRFWSGPAPAPPGATPFPARPAPLSVGDGGLWSTVGDLLRWNQALHTDELGISALLHSTGTLDDGTPLKYGWGVAVREHNGYTVHSHGGAWPTLTSKLVRLPTTGQSVAVIAAADGIERMVTLTDRLLDLLAADIRR